MAFEFIRKLSFHRKHFTSEEKLRKSSSASGSSSGSSGISATTIIPKLPSNLLELIFNRLSFFQQFKLRALRTDVKRHFDERIEQITTLTVSKKSLASYCDGKGWEKHKNAQVAIRMTGDSAEIVVDERWTAKDIECVVGLMGIFRKSLLNVTIDAPIAELLVVSLSPLDLQRWYAFQCYMKVHNVFDAVEDEEQHVIVPSSSSQNLQAYWPNVESLTVKTTRQQSPHLARILDYGVLVNNVLNRKKLSNIKVVYTDVQQNFRALARNVFPFRCWAGSAGFDHRFYQEFAGKNREILKTLPFLKVG